MLVLGIKPGDYIVVGDNIVIQAIEFDNQIRMGIDAPKDVTSLPTAPMTTRPTGPTSRRKLPS